MKINLNVDVGSIFVGVVIGLVIAPYIYDKKKVKHAAKIGAAKEVAVEAKKSVKGIFNRKDKE